MLPGVVCSNFVNQCIEAWLTDFLRYLLSDLNKIYTVWVAWLINCLRLVALSVRYWVRRLLVGCTKNVTWANKRGNGGESERTITCMNADWRSCPMPTVTRSVRKLKLVYFIQDLFLWKHIFNGGAQSIIYVFETKMTHITYSNQKNKCLKKQCFLYDCNSWEFAKESLSVTFLKQVNTV